jgi:type IV pilus assembly protein PilC
MAEFVCKVADSTGHIAQQVETAKSEAEARQKLAERGLYVFSVRTQGGIFAQLNGSGGSKALRPTDFLIFNQQFNTLIKAGLPILTALDLLAERAAAVRLRPILTEVRQRVRDGALLSEAIIAQGIFPGVYCTSIMAGEKSGNLTGVLEHYIAYQRISTGFRNRLRTILIYPSILVCAVTVVLAYLVTFAIPKFAELYSQLGTKLPPLTEFVLAVSLPIRQYIFYLVGAFFGLIVLLVLWLRTAQGSLTMDRLKPRLPLVGDIWVKAQVAQFVRTLSTLLAGGTPLVSALETASDSLGSRLISSSVRQAAERVREGQSLSSGLRASGLIPSLALEMIEVGEASGALAAMLSSVAEFYEEEVNLRLTNILTWVEPAILIVMAFIVAFILISLYLPMFSLNMGASG